MYTKIDEQTFKQLEGYIEKIANDLAVATATQHKHQNNTKRTGPPE